MKCLGQGHPAETSPKTQILVHLTVTPLLFDCTSLQPCCLVPACWSSYFASLQGRAKSMGEVSRLVWITWQVKEGSSHLSPQLREKSAVHLGGRRLAGRPLQVVQGGGLGSLEFKAPSSHSFPQLPLCAELPSPTTQRGQNSYRSCLSHSLPSKLSSLLQRAYFPPYSSLHTAYIFLQPNSAFQRPSFSSPN